MATQDRQNDWNKINSLSDDDWLKWYCREYRVVTNEVVQSALFKAYQDASDSLDRAGEPNQKLNTVDELLSVLQQTGSSIHVGEGKNKNRVSLRLYENGVENKTIKRPIYENGKKVDEKNVFSENITKLAGSIYSHKLSESVGFNFGTHIEEALDDYYQQNVSLNSLNSDAIANKKRYQEIAKNYSDVARKAQQRTQAYDDFSEKLRHAIIGVEVDLLKKQNYHVESATQHNYLNYKTHRTTMIADTKASDAFNNLLWQPKIKITDRNESNLYEDYNFVRTINALKKSENPKDVALFEAYRQTPQYQNLHSNPFKPKPINPDHDDTVTLAYGNYVTACNEVIEARAELDKLSLTLHRHKPKHELLAELESATIDGKPLAGKNYMAVKNGERDVSDFLTLSELDRIDSVQPRTVATPEPEPKPAKKGWEKFYEDEAKARGEVIDEPVQPKQDDSKPKPDHTYDFIVPSYKIADFVNRQTDEQGNFSPMQAYSGQRFITTHNKNLDSRVSKLNASGVGHDGSVYPMGDIDALMDKNAHVKVIVTEGLATAASAYQQARHEYPDDNVVALASFDAGNIEKTGKQIAEHWDLSNKQIIFACDNDVHIARFDDGAIMIRDDYSNSDVQTLLAGNIDEISSPYLYTMKNDDLLTWDEIVENNAFDEMKSNRGKKAKETILKTFAQAYPDNPPDVSAFLVNDNPNTPSGFDELLPIQDKDGNVKYADVKMDYNDYLNRKAAILRTQFKSISASDVTSSASQSFKQWVERGREDFKATIEQVKTQKKAQDNVVAATTKANNDQDAKATFQSSIDKAGLKKESVKTPSLDDLNGLGRQVHEVTKQLAQLPEPKRVDFSQFSNRNPTVEKEQTNTITDTNEAKNTSKLTMR